MVPAPKIYDPANEEFLAYQAGDGHIMPLICADQDKILDLVHLAEKICNEHGETYKLKRFKLAGNFGNEPG